MNDSGLQQASPVAAETQPARPRLSHKQRAIRRNALRAARREAIKRASRTVGGRPLAVDELHMIDEEIAKYA